MGRSCKDIAQSLVDCIKKSDCVTSGRGTIRSCLKGKSNTNIENNSNNTNLEDENIPVLEGAEECQQLRNAYYTCKRAGLDMRTRIRGTRVY